VGAWSARTSGDVGSTNEERHSGSPRAACSLLTDNPSTSRSTITWTPSPRLSATSSPATTDSWFERSGLRHRGSLFSMQLASRVAPTVLGRRSSRAVQHLLTAIVCWETIRAYGRQLACMVRAVAGGPAATATHPVHSRARRRSGRLEAAACECRALTHPSRRFVLRQCATRRRPSEGLGNAYAVHTDQWELALDAGTRPL
jgi:hypothetical protein